jgi:hypothetical protein
VNVDFLTPLGALFALAAVVPLAALVLHERRLRRLRAILQLDQPELGKRLPTALALAAIPLLIGIALAQPVVRLTDTQRVRQDAQVFYVLDVSRSMLAAPHPEARTRFERATRAALRLRAALADIPAGLASMTDRVVPHVFPTSDEEVFTAALTESMRVNSPPPRGFEQVSTLFESLDTLVGSNFFSPGIRHRLAIVLTDGESRPYYEQTLRDALAGGERPEFLIVRFWDGDERIWSGDPADRAFRADSSSERMVAQLASITGGDAFEEDQLATVAARARAVVGDGPVLERGESLRVVSLARWLVLAALVPLAVLLWRRNLV